MKYRTTDKESINCNKKNEIQIKKLFHTMTANLMQIYVIFYLCIFPLCLHDKYFDIMGFRFDLFWKPTLAYGCIFVIMGLLYIMCDGLYNNSAILHGNIEKFKEIGFSNIAEFTKKDKVNKVMQFLHINTIDVAVTMLLIICSVSTVLAEYPYEAFWGNRGRCQGLMIWLMFYIAYWLVTRFYEFKKWHLWCYMICASAVCIWGVLNFFLLTFNMFENANDIFKYTFVSSIGNINTYTNFTGILFGISTAVFISSEKTNELIFSYIVMFIASLAQIMGLSDNAILSTGIVYSIVPFIYWKSLGNIARYFCAVLTYLTALKITSLITLSGINTMNDLDPSIQISIAGKGIFMILMGVILLIVAILGVIAFKEKKCKVVSKFSENIRCFKIIWIFMLIAGALATVIILILANNDIKKEWWVPYSNFLIFNDSWGTGRGLCWRLGMEYWTKDATLLMKLFGYGPDTFYIITMDRFMNVMQDAGYGMFDSAHNEYFEYFLTIGILGLGAYLSFLFFSLKKMICHGNNSSKIIAVGVLAYAFQALVNIAVPITTPVFMIMIYIGIVSCKKNMAYNHLCTKD